MRRAALLMSLACALAAPAARAERVTVGVTGAYSDAAIYIAAKEGYFADAGVEVELVRFSSAALMLAPLAAGELAVGGGAVTAGLYNAAGRDVGIELVADKAHIAPGQGFAALMVRRALVAEGSFRGYRDLRGLHLAVTAHASGDAALLARALAKGGIAFAAANIVNLGTPEQAAAFANGALDAAIAVEPIATLLARAGAAERFAGADDFAPGAEVAVTYFSGKFAAGTAETAQRFMQALVRGMRFYNDALADGRLAGPRAAELIAILAEATGIHDRALFRTMVPIACDPDGRLDRAALGQDWRFFKDSGQIDGSVTVNDLVDPRFVKDAVLALGPYRRGGRQ